MVNLELMSDNLILVLDTVLANQEICKYIHYNDNTPLSHPNIPDTSVLIGKKVFPTPFNLIVEDSDQSHLHIYYGIGDIKDNSIDDLVLYFDIVVAKKLWMISEGTKDKIRPYQIVQKIVNEFRNTSVNTIGRLNFTRFRPLFVNEKYDAIRLEARVITFSGGK